LAKAYRKRHNDFIQILADMLAILEEDPLNRTRTHQIRSSLTSRLARGNTGFGSAGGAFVTMSQTAKSHSDIADCAEKIRTAEVSQPYR
jgi:hypothetical protein